MMYTIDRARRLGCRRGGVWLFLVAILAGWGSAPAAGLPWHDARSDQRLLVFPARAERSRLLVELPPNLQGAYRDATAWTAAGQPLQRRLIQRDGTLVAVEFAVPWGTRTEAQKLVEQLTADDFLQRQALHVYLHAAPIADQAQRPPELPAGGGVGLYAAIESIKARPSTATEFRVYAARYPSMPFRHEADATPQRPDELAPLVDRGPQADGSRRRNKEDYRALRYTFTAMLVVDAAGTWEFAVPRVDTGPWFLELDGQELLSWGNPPRREANWLQSAAIPLEPGLHRICFGGAIDDEQTTPVLHARQAGADAYSPLTAAAFACDATPAVLMQDRRDDVTAPGLALVQEQVWMLAETGDLIAQTRYLDLSRNLYGREVTARSLQGSGAPLDLAQRGLVFLPGNRDNLRYTVRDAHGYQRDLLFPWRVSWVEARHVSMHFEIAHLPLLQPRDGVLTVPYDARMHIPAATVVNIATPEQRKDVDSGTQWPVPAAVSSRLHIQVSRFLPDGKLIDRDRIPVPPVAHRRILQIPFSDRNVATIELQPVLDATAVGPPRRIRLVGPAEFLALPDPVSASGGSLRSAGDYLLLRRLATHPSTLETPDLTLDRVLLLDSFLAIGRHPTDHLAPADWFAPRHQIQVQHQPLDGRSLQRYADRLAKFAALPSLPDTQVRGVVWAVGVEDIQSGSDLVDFADTLAFLIEATLAVDRIPILVTPPALRELSDRPVRDYALAVKELGAKYAVPVVDLYSLSLLAGDIDAYYRIDAEGATPLHARTPNAAGRAWYFRQILKTLEHHNFLHERQN